MNTLEKQTPSVNLVLSAILCITSISAFSQQKIKLSDLRPGKDTVYIGIINKLALSSSASLTGVTSGNATVDLINDSLVVKPTGPGKIEITLQYKDSVKTKSLMAVYLPYPAKEN